jgi:hypothetical protein
MYPSIEAGAHRVQPMPRIAVKLGFMKVLPVNVCTKAEIDKETRQMKPCFRANFQLSAFETGTS